MLYITKVPPVPKEKCKVCSLPKDDYYKKPLVSEDNYKKVSYVPKVSSMPKEESKVPSLSKNDNFMKTSIPEYNYKKVSYVPKYAFSA